MRQVPHRALRCGAWLCIGTGASVALAQPALSPAERECAQAVQGKVAWSQAGARQWQPANVTRLCAGVTNVPARIECFQREVKQHNDWSRGIAACAATGAAPTPSAAEPTPATAATAQIDLTGQWTRLGPDGGGNGGFGDLVTVRQKGRAFIADIDKID